MKISFDTEGITSSCPVADAGMACDEECRDCEYLVEFDGFDVICNYEEPQPIKYKVVKDCELPWDNYANEGPLFSRGAISLIKEPEQEE